jgi:hypothetical protein
MRLAAGSGLADWRSCTTDAGGAGVMHPDTSTTVADNIHHTGISHSMSIELLELFQHGVPPPLLHLNITVYGGGQYSERNLPAQVAVPSLSGSTPQCGSSFPEQPRGGVQNNRKCTELAIIGAGFLAPPWNQPDPGHSVPFGPGSDTDTNEIFLAG